MAYEAKIILDSVGPNGARLTTFEFTYPRFVHAEFMTHRMMSRNSASSRAIPVDKMIDRIWSDPVLPVWWGKNQSGMQAREELNSKEIELAKDAWLNLRTKMISGLITLQKLGLHKQIANRVIEPWMFITVVATATEWNNLRALRVHPDAQPEFRETMAKAFDLYDKSEPMKLDAGQWHLPYVRNYDFDQLINTGASINQLLKISVGRCAAVSYLNQDKRDAEADYLRAQKNLEFGHMSPWEHQGRALTYAEWHAMSAEAFDQWYRNRVPTGNLWGWEQLRKTLTNEHDFSKLDKK